MQRSMCDVLSVSQEISASAQLIPDSVALSYGDQQLKYGELDQRVDRFAAFMAQLGDGAIGEIYIAGDGVGRGRNLPQSTARCFLPDPFSGEQGKRMYRTGDRARRRPDGEVAPLMTALGESASEWR